jgi:hypothetical protein
MMTVQYAQEYASDGFTFFALSPGVSLYLLVTVFLTFSDLPSG